MDFSISEVEFYRVTEYFSKVFSPWKQYKIIL